MKKVYVTPSVVEMEVRTESALALSGDIKVNDEYSEYEQLSNENVWDSLW